jgi:hypothetical protein
LIKEVREQQGKLADFNLIVDKTRSSSDARPLADELARMRKRNDENRAKVDQLFKDRNM